MMPNVTAYGLDYSARELTPQEIADYNRANPQQPIRYLIRYIGYPTNRKCISHYPGALRAFEKAGVLVLLVHQVAYLDFHGGYEAGRAHAQIALADAQREGYPDGRPIFMAFDRWLAGDPKRGIPALPIATVWQYLAGAASVLGWSRTGLYGFFDVIHPAIRENRVMWTWLCGAESNVIDGVDFYQWNNGRVYPGRPPLECDLNKSYVDLAVFTGKATAPKGSDDVATFLVEQYDDGNEVDSPLMYLLHGNYITGLSKARAKATIKSWPTSVVEVGVSHAELMDFIGKSEATLQLPKHLERLEEAVRTISLGGDPAAFAKLVGEHLGETLPDATAEATADEIDERQRERLGTQEVTG